ncbi:hypothetical protein RJ640_006961 [Escallonia rubra]|uniref:Glycosyltransferase n=1 Tax=Escallonia rubra TaxID=112253 RepID=A0AA88UWQ1_9ASTE|nr:hypothetical protein RJ640_006961 [Escallonia rubra]
MEMEDIKLHVLFLPYFTPSHMIPLVDTARQFAAGGVDVTIIATPSNALLFQNSIDHAIISGHRISVQMLKFPSTEVGLPEGIENFSAITSPEMASKVFHAIGLLQKPMEQLIRSLGPDCIFSDMFFPWTVNVAKELNIPRLLFYPSSFFYHCVSHSLKIYAPHEKVHSDTENFLIPGLPDAIEMKRSQLQEHVKTQTMYGEIIKVIKESELLSYGAVHNTIYELEPAYADHYRNVKGMKAWHVGPLFHFSRVNPSKTFISAQHTSLSWLDTQRAKSVLYVCFGSMVRFPETQLREIALALEASNFPFVWFVRKREEHNEDEEESWFPSGFEAQIRQANKGLVIRGWAPQLMILDHPAIGGFMNHCGWNSVLEAVTAGVPMITWPLYAEQFYNEKLVELLRVGVRVGTETWNSSPEITGPLVGKDEIVEAITRLMGDSDEVKQIRQQAKEKAVMAKRAVEEGGSSYNDLAALIDELKSCSQERMNNFAKKIRSAIFVLVVFNFEAHQVSAKALSNPLP